MEHQNPSPAEPRPAAASSVYDLSIDDLNTHITQLINEPYHDPGNPFVTHEVDHWLEQNEQLPESRKLFGELWFEHELCILFSDTNVGKSILAVQIGRSIARGEGLSPFAAEAGRQRVLYFDFELSLRQFSNRYVDSGGRRHVFGKGLLRSELNPQMEVPADFNSFEDFVCYRIAHEVIATQAKVVIVDNLTYLRSETERAKDALPLMKQLKRLKEELGLSILALAHTPKRDRSAPITRNDISGSKMLINFCDSAFSIGESTQDPQLRYLKQIKQRNTEELYGDRNVLLYRIVKPTDFLHYEYLGTGNEWEHLKQRSPEDEVNQTEQIMALHAQGMSLRQIAAEVGNSHSMVGRTINRMKQI